MKKRSRISIVGAGVAMALVALTGGVSVPKLTYANRNVNVEQQQEKQKALASQIKSNHRVIRENAGGLDLVRVGEYGMSPKEHGIRFGNGKSRKGKTNYLKLSHGFKVKKR